MAATRASTQGITFSMYDGDPDGNQLEFPVECFANNDDTNASMHRTLSINPIGVEHEPEEWLVELRSGTSVEDLRRMQTISTYCHSRRSGASGSSNG